MAKYIHVTSAGKVPENRGTSASPFEDYALDPNDGVMFGPGERTMFLPVDEPANPVSNTVLEQATATYTPDIAGQNVRGVYVPGEELWRFSWIVSTQDLDTAKAIKKDQLLSAQSDALDLGYTVGNFTFPFTEDFFRQLADRHYWLDIAINDGEVPVGAAITFSDQNGAEVSVTLAQLRSNFRQYGSDYLRIFEKEVDARDAIEAAADPAAVDAVAWDFSAP